LEKDLQSAGQSMSYDGAARARSLVSVRNNPLAETSSDSSSNGEQIAAPEALLTQWPLLPNGAPDFARMNSDERRAYDRFRLSQRFG
jgi:hypothetical protein